MVCKYSNWNRGQDEALLNKLGGEEVALRLLNCREVTVTFDAASKQATIAAVAPESEAVLHLISGGEEIIIEPTDGTETIPAAKETFAGYIDPDFKRWNADEASGSTPATPVTVHELVKDATFIQMFGSVGPDPQKMCLTQSQIVEFCRTHRKWLREGGYATFFLFQSCGNFFVASVDVLDYGRLRVRVCQLEFDDVWHAVDRHRMVLPKL